MIYLTDKAWWRHLGRTLKYSLYICTHPLDGFWDLTHEKRGSIAAANVIVFASVIIEILRLTLTNFQFIKINMEYFNAIIVFMRILLPVFLWTVANWSLTTLMDGKGKMSDIYMAISYALVPSVIINAIMIILSQVLTFDEGAVYWFLAGFSTLWTGILILAGMMMVHDYSIGKTILSSFLTIIGMGVMVFVFVIFFSLVSDSIAYFISLYKEILFRVI
ncbi:MAG: YIP1 family protein [Spirochaetes bacterium]|nr:YIP1 family protein [Brevinematales bacterium]MCL1959376.1 YIP1 family protein [Spirochaetota bacterium]